MSGIMVFFVFSSPKDNIKTSCFHHQPAGRRSFVEAVDVTESWRFSVISCIERTPESHVALDRPADVLSQSPSRCILMCEVLVAHQEGPFVFQGSVKSF